MTAPATGILEGGLMVRARPPLRTHFGRILAVALAAHAALLAIEVAPWETPGAMQRMAVKLISAGAAPQTTPAAPAEPAARPEPQTRPEPVAMPSPVAPAATTAAVPVTDATAVTNAVGESAPAEEAAAAASTPVTEARVDTAYLDNPRPAYPPMSRRLGEEGTVLLRVTVNAQGQVTLVAVEKSCGHERLDAAARAAVQQWRFIAARRGDTTVASTVLVPVTFALAGGR